MTALEATLGQLVNVNSLFHNKSRSAADKSLASEQAQLRQSLDVAYDNLKAQRASERHLASDVEQAESRLKGYTAEQQVRGAGSHCRHTYLSTLNYAVVIE